jgi:hypothetical protein
MLLPFGSLSLLCSLPLEHLDLEHAGIDDYDGHDAHILLPAHAAAPVADVSFSLRTLHLPERWPLNARLRSSECWRRTASTVSATPRLSYNDSPCS